MHLDFSLNLRTGSVGRGTSSNEEMNTGQKSARQLASKAGQHAILLIIILSTDRS